jgi:hypothetical protein
VSAVYILVKTLEEKIHKQNNYPSYFCSVAFLLSASSANVWFPSLRNNTPRGSITVPFLDTVQNQAIFPKHGRSE